MINFWNHIESEIPCKVPNCKKIFIEFSREYFITALTATAAHTQQDTGMTVNFNFVAV